MRPQPFEAQPKAVAERKQEFWFGFATVQRRVGKTANPADRNHIVEQQVVGELDLWRKPRCRCVIGLQNAAAAHLVNAVKTYRHHDACTTRCDHRVGEPHQLVVPRWRRRCFGVAVRDPRLPVRIKEIVLRADAVQRQRAGLMGEKLRQQTEVEDIAAQLAQPSVGMGECVGEPRYRGGNDVQLCVAELRNGGRPQTGEAIITRKRLRPLGLAGAREQTLQSRVLLQVEPTNRGEHAPSGGLRSDGLHEGFEIAKIAGGLGLIECVDHDNAVAAPRPSGKRFDQRAITGQSEGVCERIQIELVKPIDR